MASCILWNNYTFYHLSINDEVTTYLWMPFSATRNLILFQKDEWWLPDIPPSVIFFWISFGSATYVHSCFLEHTSWSQHSGSSQSTRPSILHKFYCDYILTHYRSNITLPWKYKYLCLILPTIVIICVIIAFQLNLMTTIVSFPTSMTSALPFLFTGF